MESLRELYKIGSGPSSSHTMGPEKAALEIQKKYPQADHYEVHLYGSLSFTGKGHLTDYAIARTLGIKNVHIHFEKDALNFHPNGMIFHVYNKENECIAKETVYSIGGGSILFEGQSLQKRGGIYPHDSMADILRYIKKEKSTLYDYILRYEGFDIVSYLRTILDTMFRSVEEGLQAKGILPGRLKLQRVAASIFKQAQEVDEKEQERLFISSYAYAVSEQNASGNTIVTAPTCGASGVMPAVLYYCYKQLHIPKEKLIEALAVGGLFGNIIKTKATVSGADGGCQAEVGSACAMTASAYAWILGLNHDSIAYAAEMGIEHNLGLTCDPVGGYVQIPCIERNGFGALRAVDAAVYAKQVGSIRKNRVSFDAVVQVMKETGRDLNSAYKETALGGLAKVFTWDED